MSVEDQTLADLVNEVFRLFRTLKSISVHETPADEPGLAHIGILGLLARDGECRATDVAATIGIGPSALSRQLAELESKGLVERQPDPQDGRASLIQLSEAGAALLTTIMTRRAARMRELLEDWSEDDARDALSAVARLVTALREPLHAPHQGAHHRAPHSPRAVAAAGA
ncbi:MAG: MarR family winged helix-turn-helix transcriptional regulator [Actinomycetales bacterium]